MRKRTSDTLGDKIEKYPDCTVDVFIRTLDGTEICIDITTVKPSKKEFRALKRKLLMWTAIRYSQDKTVKFEPYIAIPYNPSSGEYKNHNQNYDRQDLLVGDELWKKVSNNEFGIVELINIFQDIGNDLEGDIDKAMKELK